MFNIGDQVEVMRSKRDIIGPGEIVDQAFAGRFLVKMDTKPKPTIIVVAFQDMRKNNSSGVNTKKK